MAFDPTPLAKYRPCGSSITQAGLVLGILIGFLFLYFFSLLLRMFAIDSGKHRLRLLFVALRSSKDNSQASVQDEFPESTTTAKEPPQWDDAVRTLCKAMARGDVDFVSRTLKTAPSLANKSNQARYSLLHAAVFSNNVEVVSAALELPGIDVGSVDKSDLGVAVELNVREAGLNIRPANTKGATPLHYACMIGNIEIATMLLEHGAAFSVGDNEGREPVAYFDVHKHSEALATYQGIIKDRQEWYDHLYETCTIDGLAKMISENNFKSFERSVRKYPFLAACHTRFKFFPLQMAVIRKLRPFVELLLSVAPSIINYKDERANDPSDESLLFFAPSTYPYKYVNGATALHYACLTGDLAIIELLLKAGADWNIVDRMIRKPEDLIYEGGRNGGYVKREFIRLREEEAKRRGM